MASDKAPEDGAPAAAETPAVQQPKNQKEWHSTSKTTLSLCQKKNEACMKHVMAMEKAEQDRIAAIEAEKARQKRLAAEAAERARKEELRRQAEELKRQQAADLKARNEEAAQMKRNAAQALKAATAAFHGQVLADAFEKEKAYQHKSMSDALQKLGNYISKCKHSCHMKYSSNMQCEMRLKMREDRPATELFKDHVQEALEREYKVVKSARDELTDLVTKGEELRAEMEECMVLTTTSRSRANVARRCDKFQQLPHLKASVEATPSAQELLKKTYSLVDRANKIINKSEETLLRTDRDCAAASLAANNSLDQRAAETGALQKQLAKQKNDTHKSLKDADYRVMMMKMRQHKTNGNDEKTHATHENAHVIMKELEQQRQEVWHDWRQKTAALQIDIGCRRLTKVRAGIFRSEKTPISSSPKHSQSMPAL